MGWESPSHWLIIAILVIALFGYKKLPDAARSLGRSLRIFKTEVKGMSEDDKAREDAKASEDAKAQPQLEPEPPAVATPAVTPGTPSAVTPPPAVNTAAAHTTANANSDKPTTSVE